MGEDACWSLELVETAGRAGRDGRRCLLELVDICLLELVDSWTCGKRWETMVAGAGRQLDGKSRRAGKGRQLGGVMAVHALEREDSWENSWEESREFRRQKVCSRERCWHMYSMLQV